MTVFVATSRRFYPEARRLCDAIEARGHRTYHPFFEQDPSVIEADPAMKIAVTREHFPELVASDVIYALTPGGYVGASVLMEMAYAFALGKRVVTSAPVNEVAARALVSGVRSPEEFLASLRGDSPSAGDARAG